MLAAESVYDGTWSSGEVPEELRDFEVMLATGSSRPETLRFYEGAGFARGGKTFFQVRRP